jgi:hypothetical protein
MYVSYLQAHIQEIFKQSLNVINPNVNCSDEIGILGPFICHSQVLPMLYVQALCEDSGVIDNQS